MRDKQALVLRWGQSAYERDADLALERQAAELHGFEWAAAPDARVQPSGLSDVEILVVTSKTSVDVRVAEQMAGRLVLTTTSGVDHIDLAACERYGVTVGRCPLARRDPVVEHTVMSLTMLMREADPLWQAARAGRWVRGELPRWSPRGLSDATVVVVGFGVIGRRVTEVLEAMGASVRVVDPYAVMERRGWRLEEALLGADAVTLHCALTPSSRGLLSREMLELLPEGAVVVNTARGESLDVEHAVALVGQGRLRGLSVDVFPVEPYPAMAASRQAGVFLSPHGAGYTRGLGARVAREVGTVIASWATGGTIAHPVRPSRAA